MIISFNINWQDLLECFGITHEYNGYIYTGIYILLRSRVSVGRSTMSSLAPLTIYHHQGKNEFSPLRWGQSILTFIAYVDIVNLYRSTTTISRNTT